VTAATYEFDAEIWEHVGASAWRFVCLPEADTDDIDERFGHLAAGFGSLRVEVTIGSSRWKTSIFPDTKRGTFLLPVKKSVRKAENLPDGAIAHVILEIVQP
jgi:Domain of unknown function (DUF1905)